MAPELLEPIKPEPPSEELLEPLAMWRRLADPDPDLFNTNHPLHPFAKSLFEHNWRGSVEEIAQKIGQEPDQIRKLARILSGVLSHDEETDTISLIMPEGNGQHATIQE